MYVQLVLTISFHCTGSFGDQKKLNWVSHLEKINCYNIFGGSDLCLEIKLNKGNTKRVLSKKTSSVLFIKKRKITGL